MVLGTDYPFPLGELKVGSVVESYPDGGKELREKIFWKNPVKLFRLDELTLLNEWKWMKNVIEVWQAKTSPRSGTEPSHISLRSRICCQVFQVALLCLFIPFSLSIIALYILNSYNYMIYMRHSLPPSKKHCNENYYQSKCRNAHDWLILIISHLLGACYVTRPC